MKIRISMVVVLIVVLAASYNLFANSASLKSADKITANHSASYDMTDIYNALESEYNIKLPYVTAGTRPFCTSNARSFYMTKYRIK